MNDRLKFRAWVEDVDLEDENGNEYKKSFMIYDIAVFGGYRVGHYGEDLERQLELQGFSEDEIEQFEDDWCLEEGDDWFNFDADEIEQCTGLKDKNGKLIYEGDIINQVRYNAPYSSKRKSKNIKCIVKWDDLRLCYYFDNIEKEMDFIYFNINEPNDVEVIGNIHKNPELLK